VAPLGLERRPLALDSWTVSTSPIIQRLAQLRFQGTLTAAEATAQGATLVATSHGAETAADHIQLALLVDAQGVVRSARYTTTASGELLALYDGMSELTIGQPLAGLGTITPRQAANLLCNAAGGADGGIVLGADADVPFYVLTKAAERGLGKAPAESASLAGDGSAVLPWSEVGLFEKVRRIEGVLDQHVRPALASDGGGMDLVDLKADELFVQYHGACGSCSSSIGGTLQFVQDSLNNHLGTALQVKVSGVDEAGPDFIH